MNQELELLKSCADADDLKPLLHSICSGFGEVSRLDVLVASRVGKRQAMCFLRMATLEQEQALMRELRMGRFGGDVVLIVDLKPKSIEPSKNIGLGAWRHDRDRTVRQDFQPTLPIACSQVSPVGSSASTTQPPTVSHWIGRDAWYG